MKRKRLYVNFRRKAWLIAGFLLTFWEGFNVAYAQSGAGPTAIGGATSEIKGYYDPLKKLIWIIAGCLGLVGAFRLYNKFTSSDPESSKHATNFLGGGIALVAAEVFIRKMFIE